MTNTPASAMRELRAKRKAAGVCIHCGDLLLTEVLCERHAEIVRRSKEPLAQREKKRYPIRRKGARRG